MEWSKELALDGRGWRGGGVGIRRLDGRGIVGSRGGWDDVVLFG